MTASFGRASTDRAAGRPRHGRRSPAATAQRVASSTSRVTDRQAVLPMVRRAARKQVPGDQQRLKERLESGQAAPTTGV